MVLGPSSSAFESIASNTGLEGPLGMARITLFCVRIAQAVHKPFSKEGQKFSKAWR